LQQPSTIHFDAVLFDCDGVLVDSESLTCQVLRDMLEERGWRMTLAQCMAQFVGKTVREERELIAQRTGQPWSEDWLQDFYRRRNDALRDTVQAVPGAHQAVQAASAHTGGCIACASGADRFKVEMMLQRVGLLPFFGTRIFSGHELPRSKPAPDVYLAAAAALGVASARCLVIEDTATGVQAGLSAGATVWGYDPAGLSAPFDGLAVARVFRSMNALATALTGATDITPDAPRSSLPWPQRPSAP